MTLTSILSNNHKPVNFIFCQIEGELEATLDRFFQGGIENVPGFICNICRTGDSQCDDHVSQWKTVLISRLRCCSPSILWTFPIAVPDVFCYRVLTEEPSVTEFAKNKAVVLTILFKLTGSAVEVNDFSIMFILDQYFCILTADFCLFS